MTNTKSIDAVEPNKNLEAEIEFSWKRVFKRGIQNMKDDVDPVYKGTKMGWYALHGIPTWIRESRDGRLSTDSKGWSTLSGLFVFGTSATAYVLGTMEAVEAVGNQGYSLLAVPLAAQGISYVRESFRRAKKTELENIVMTKIQRTLNGQEEGEYDLNCKKMIGTLADKLYTQREKEVEIDSKAARENINHLKEDINTVEKATDINSVEKHHQIKMINSRIARQERDTEKGRQDLAEYKEKALVEAREGLVYLAREVFNGLFADNNLGKRYEIGATRLEVGPRKRRRDYEREMHFECSPCLDERSVVAELIGEVVAKNGGTANVELFGKLTAIYGSKHNQETHYKVIPNNIWKK